MLASEGYQRFLHRRRNSINGFYGLTIAPT